MDMDGGFNRESHPSTPKIRSEWVIAIYFHITLLKGVSGMKPHRDIEVTRKTAWSMLKRIRFIINWGFTLAAWLVERTKRSPT